MARLRTILRLQRDEFLPLRVIRQELAVRARRGGRRAAAGGRRRRRRRPQAPPRPAARPPAGAVYSLDDVVEETRADPKLIQELEDYGVIAGQQRGGTMWYDDTEREIVRAVVELARYGVGGTQPARLPHARPIASRRCCSRSSRRRCARAIPSAVARRSTRSRTSRRSRRTSSTCCSCATCASSSRERAARRCAALVRDIPGFPQPGIVFKDITPLLADAGGSRRGGDRPRGSRAPISSPTS